MNRLGDEDETAICMGPGDICIGEQTCPDRASTGGSLAQAQRADCLSSCLASYALTRRQTPANFYLAEDAS